MRLGMIRVDGERLAVTGDRLVVPLQRVQRNRETAVRLDRVRVDGERVLRACERIEDALDRRSASFETAALS